MRLLSDHIKEYIAFTEDECQQIIDYYENNKYRARRSEIYSKSDPDKKISSNRTSNSMVVPLDESIDEIISEKISKFFVQYMVDINNMFIEEWNKYPEKDDIPGNLLLTFEYEDEGYTIVKYDSNVGIFDWHWDRMDDNGKTSNRVFSCIIYLNDNFDEGETDFHFHKVTPKTGKIVFFPSGHHWVHKGRVPKNGDKYIITTWLSQGEIPEQNADHSKLTSGDFSDYIRKFQK